MIKITVIDGQGGNMGKAIIKSIKESIDNCTITAIGTNAIATLNMIKASPDKAATGENALICSCRNADFIVGPIGIVIADSLVGEISPIMASSVGQSNAIKILLPVNKCNNIIVGIADVNLNTMISQAVNEISKKIQNEVDRPVFL